MSALERLDRFWYMPAPAARLAVLRALVGSYALIYLLVRWLSLMSVTRFDASSFEPVGPVRLLAAPLPAWLVQLSLIAACSAGVAFVLGFKYRVAGPLFALSFLWVTSYRSSWGMVFHTENLPALHLLLLAVAPAADALSLDARTRAHDALPESGRYGWALRAIGAVTVVTYVLAGIAKLRLAGSDWVGGDVLRAQVAYDNLRKIELGSTHSPLGALLVAYAWPFRFLAWASMALELGAPLALLGGRTARLWVVFAFSFHLGVVALMAIGFPYQLSLIAYASFFPLERALDWPAVARLRARLARQ
ncbi:MAG: hypothetical protein JWN48_4373 [Myxococcaceae bacterium]|nr:hypothetical protein [Myxococcaceae bacterium]